VRSTKTAIAASVKAEVGITNNSFNEKKGIANVDLPMWKRHPLWCQYAITMFAVFRSTERAVSHCQATGYLLAPEGSPDHPTPWQYELDGPTKKFKVYDAHQEVVAYNLSEKYALGITDYINSVV
jgi:hypothetical protein